jgi:LemA protein
MKKIAIIISALVILLLIWSIATYNSFISAQEEVSSAWGQVENVYQRRADLIPNLVSTVKGYAAHERSTFESVVQARTKALSVHGGNLSEEEIQEYQQAQGAVSSSLGRLLVIAENYPELKSNENFLDLQAQLEGTENRIAEARRVFNETAKKYNRKVRYFPSNIIASLFGFEKKGYFEADTGANQVPKIEF